MSLASRYTVASKRSSCGTTAGRSRTATAPGFSAQGLDHRPSPACHQRPSAARCTIVPRSNPFVARPKNDHRGPQLSQGPRINTVVAPADDKLVRRALTRPIANPLARPLGAQASSNRRRETFSQPTKCGAANPLTCPLYREKPILVCDRSRDRCASLAGTGLHQMR
jgi:hypothetical protein